MLSENSTMDCKGKLYFTVDCEEDLGTVDCKEELCVTFNCKEEPYVTRHCKEENEKLSNVYEVIPQETITENEEKLIILSVTRPPSPIIHEVDEALFIEETSREKAPCSALEDMDLEEWRPDSSNSSSVYRDLSCDDDWEPELSVRRKRRVNKSKKKATRSTNWNVADLQPEKKPKTKFECSGCPYAFSSELFLKRHEKYCRHHEVVSRLVKEKDDCESEGSAMDEPSPNLAEKPITIVTEADEVSRTNSTHEASAEVRICMSEANTESEAIYKCKICSEWFFNEKMFKTHRKTHFDTELDTLYYYCPKCEIPFSQKHDLRNHIRGKHNTETPFKCDQCEKTFRRKGHLNMHLRTHVDKEFTTCKFCDKKFLLEERYKEHLAKHQEGLLVCPKCGTEFVRESAFHKHVKKHDEPLFTCGECNKKFWQSRHLKTHLRSHNGEQPYKCTECGKKFSLRENLKRHRRSHSDDRPFACGKCGKQFAVKSNLQKHEWTHSDKKPHVCNICSRQFGEKNSLTRHMRTHSGEKPYLCSFCDMSFSRKHHVKLHLLKYHKEDGGDGIGVTSK